MASILGSGYEVAAGGGSGADVAVCESAPHDSAVADFGPSGADGQGEQWRPVAGGWEGVYEVSDLGRVRRVARGNRTRPGFVLSPFMRGGYPHVDLSRDGAQTMFAVHVLVMRSHVGEPPPGHEVDHRDRDPRNARLSNLRYVTHPVNQANRRPFAEWNVAPGKRSCSRCGGKRHTSAQCFDPSEIGGAS